jgi:2'-5' RNA ligase
LFVALELSKDTVRAIEEWRKPLVRSFPLLKWTSASQLHITMRFLGDRNPEDVIFQMKALALGELLPVEYTLSDTGSFGKPPSVIWLSGKFSSSLFTIVHRLGTFPTVTVKQERTENSFPILPWQEYGPVCSVRF